jgi:hypothetical protein
MENVFGFSTCDNRLLFGTMMNAIVLHQFWLSYNFELLMTKEVGDWVKAKNTTWSSEVGWTFLSELNYFCLESNAQSSI